MKSLTPEETESLEAVFQASLKIAIDKLGLNKSCLACVNFSEETEICKLYGKRPPAAIIVSGCESFESIKPF